MAKLLETLDGNSEKILDNADDEFMFKIYSQALEDYRKNFREQKNKDGDS